MSAVSALSPSPALDARLCGPMVFTWQGEVVRVPPRLGALIAYLTLDGPASRDHLREVFWPGGTNQHVRQALYSLRALPGADAWLVDAPGTAGVHATTDLPALDALLDCHEVPLAALRRWPGGDLLAGLRVENAGALEAWLTHQRAHWQARQAAAFERWGHQALETGQADVALDVARTWVALNPLDERATRLEMRASHAAGDAAQAQAAFTRLRAALRQALDAEPEDETRELHAELTGRGGVRHGRAALVAPGDSVPGGDEPLQGRATELRTLLGRLGAGHRVNLHGLAGIGKTRLAAAATQALLKGHGGRALWLTVGDDRPAAALAALHDALGVHVGQPLAPALSAHTVTLVVLDDVWDPETLGGLLRALPPALAALVTSRRRWDGLLPLGLDRLPRRDALALLRAHSPGLGEDDPEADALCALLGDHPYAVRLAGRTLHAQGLAPGNLRRSLGGAPHALGGIDALLRQSTRALGTAEYEAFLGLGSLPVSAATPEFLALALRREPAGVEDALYGLVRRGLATRDAQPGSEVVRYGMHDLTWSAARAREALLPSTVAAAALAYARAYTGDPGRLDGERGTLLEVVQRARREEDPALVDVFVAWLSGAYLAARGFPTAHVELLRDAAIMAAQAGRWQEAAVLHGKLADVQHGLIGDGVAAVHTYDEAARYAAHAGLLERQATFLGLGATLRARQRLPGVEETLERAVSCARISGDGVCMARVYEQRGMTRAMTGDFTEARNGFQAARVALASLLAEDDTHRSPAWSAFLSATGNLAQAEQRLGNLPAAAALREEVLALAVARDEHLRIAHAHAETGGAGANLLPTVDDVCAATPYEVMGQAWRVDFSAGGLMPDGNKLPTGTVYSPTVRQVFGVTRTPTVDKNVTVIVIDRFTPMPITSTADAPGKAGPQITLNVRHGALVTEHLVAMLRSDGFGQETVQGDRRTLTRTASGQTRKVTVVTLDFSGDPRITQVAQQFTAAIREVRDPVVIVNMSFVVIKCAVLRAIQAKHAEERGVRYTLDSYLTERDVPETSAARRAATRPIFEVSPLHPLFKAIAAEQADRARKGETVVAVASSGNFNGEVKDLWPGAAQSVIGVGATGWSGKILGLPVLGEKPWSSPGDTVTVGEWYTLGIDRLSDRCTSGPENRWCVATRQELRRWPKVAYRGTSFSAPSLTALLASRLTPAMPQSCLPDAAAVKNRNVDTGCFR